MDHTCKLGSKCLKEDESLERCNIAVCQNVIHLGCFKKLVATSGENEWEGPLFCGKCCFKEHKKALDAAASKAKGRVPWHSNGPTPKINSMELIGLLQVRRSSPPLSTISLINDLEISDADGKGQMKLMTISQLKLTPLDSKGLQKRYQP